MVTIDQYSKAAVEFSLSWASGGATHTEKFWADPVSFWRDVLDPRLMRDLIGQQAGGSTAAGIPAAQFHAPYDQRRIVRIRQDQFTGRRGDGEPLEPVPGRFYPQGLLTGVSGVFRGSTSPCRFLDGDGHQLTFDLNHPLAGCDLRLEATIQTIHPQNKERCGRCEDWLERISSDGPGMQALFKDGTPTFFADDNFRRADEHPDAQFYQQPRLVQHLDRVAREEIGARYAGLIPAGGRVLDLMGSWASHLPADLRLKSLTVLGLNGEELRQNKQASQSVVHDLNADPQLPFAESSFDAVICTASIEYLTKPLAVMREIARVLRPGGVVAFAFSNRWFPPKAIRIWQDLHEFERLGMVSAMLHATTGIGRIATLSRRGLPRPPDDPHPELWLSDPVYMVWGTKQAA